MFELLAHLYGDLFVIAALRTPPVRYSGSSDGRRRCEDRALDPARGGRAWPADRR
jgi:hypothetical protein